MSDIDFKDIDEKFWKAVRREQKIYYNNTNKQRRRMAKQNSDQRTN